MKFRILCVKQKKIFKKTDKIQKIIRYLHPILINYYLFKN